MHGPRKLCSLKIAGEIGYRTPPAIGASPSGGRLRETVSWRHKAPIRYRPPPLTARRLQRLFVKGLNLVTTDRLLKIRKRTLAICIIRESACLRPQRLIDRLPGARVG